MTFQDPPVSAIIPCFRCADTIRRAALSVAAQEQRPVELVLVDDASGDETGDALDSLRDELGADWVRVIRLKNNTGAASARNVGWEAARGEYVAFLDADDTWLHHKIARQYTFMSAHPEYEVSGHLAFYEEPTDSEPNEHLVDFREIGRAWILLKNPMVTPSLMIRRELPLRFNPGSRYMEDHGFLQEAVCSGVRVARIEEALAVIHKAAFGESGLSAALWPMEQGELGNLRTLLAAGHIGRTEHGLLVAYSLAKFARRLVITGMRRAIRKPPVSIRPV